MLKNFDVHNTLEINISWTSYDLHIIVSSFNCTTEEIPNIIDDKEVLEEIEVLVIASIETIERQKIKCGKDEVSN